MFLSPPERAYFGVLRPLRDQHRLQLLVYCSQLIFFHTVALEDLVDFIAHHSQEIRSDHLVVSQVEQVEHLLSISPALS